MASALQPGWAPARAGPGAGHSAAAASQVSLELWASTSPRAPERPGLCPAPPGPSETAPVRRDPWPVVCPGIAAFWGPGLGGRGVSTDLLFISPRPHGAETPGGCPQRPSFGAGGAGEDKCRRRSGPPGARGERWAGVPVLSGANPAWSPEPEPLSYPEGKKKCCPQFDHKDVSSIKERKEKNGRGWSGGGEGPEGGLGVGGGGEGWRTIRTRAGDLHQVSEPV